jgi:hypothetical protein
MNHSKVILTHLSESIPSQPVMHIPSTVIQKLHIPTTYPLELQLMDEIQPIFYQLKQTKSNAVLIDNSLAEQLGFPDQCQIKLLYSAKSNKLFFGPVLAILVSSISRTHPPCAKLNAFCEEVIVYARSRHIFAYVTTIEELLKEGKTIYGWTFTKNRWVEQKCPFPQVVYNRVGSRRVERSAQFKALKEKLENRNTRMFNQTFLNKWEVYDQLRKDQKLNPFLPKTHLFGPLALKSMLESYPVVFIKPIHGSLGRGIYRIARKYGRFQLEYTTPGGQTYTLI